MAMNAAGMASEIIAALNSAMPDFTAYPNDHRVGPTKAEYDAIYFLAVATAIINHIQSNAQATGLDSRADTHTLSIS